MGDQRLAANADVTYSYYPFLIINNLPNMMTQDINYLESQGCLRVPTRDILDIFMKQYFLHHHPLMPILNEGDFWDMYGQQGMRGSGERMSLLVFQSMLFVVCNYLSQDSIKALGFPSTRIARASLYRRAKLLYDFESESSMVYLAQAALLLSHWSPNFTHAFKKANSTWLSMAIQNAKSVEAHYYSAIPVISAAAHPAQHKRQNTLRRLWWCCIVRDRILPLGLRRSPKITRSHFDFDANPRLGYPDLDDEVHRSKVYNAETKRCLIGIFSQIVDLSIVLTSSLMLVFPLDDSPGWGKRVGAEQSEKVRECKSALRRWYESASLQFPMFGGGTARRINAMKRKESRHDSVILYTNMMYMYYHSSRVALSHHEVLQTAAAFVSPIDNLQDFSSIYENRRELQDATSGVTECLKELIQLRLARWLPISAVACTAFPLCLHIIDVNLSPHKLGSSSAPPSAQQAAKQHQLNILIAAMKTYQPQYDGVDYVSETIRHIVNLAQLDSPTPPSASNKISGWTDILASQPGCYLRLAMTMDLSFAKGRLPGLFTTGYSSVKALMRNGIATTSLTQHSPRLPNFNDARGPSPVNPTPPDRAFNAATTNLLIAENADASRALSEMHGGHGIVHLPSTESFIDASLKIEGIMSEILVPYTLQDDASSRSSSNSHSHGAGGVSYEATEEETADDWIGTAWGNEADVRMLGGEDGSDQETAQLLHALRESTGSGVTWRGKESA
ncbi:fungal-specific transcription factor domain-containing protein [Pseudomassariella vexata]|uniref:Fungal-specific transcription factor domain-domain-containing protein n=1 Tax=Pseudomassariella vexata TaxID=1141098 RepID=A0A1Y2EAT7_9PEZI|nr:fungal-specific transcription factor domain-containing protein [Pseudomassariella vexata]ORY68662.1 fungal-specific transcription factor domain-domain-containing protein [Pseudomassariella vexata]